MNIIIPMAGAGSRFSQAGYQKPKPFIDVAGKPMIVRVLENLHSEGAQYYLVARKEHLQQEADLVAWIERNYRAKFIPIEKATEGTVCTVLFAQHYINNDESLLIANSDQIVDIDINRFIDDCDKRSLDGSILTFIDSDLNPKWSFARINEMSYVEEVREKEAISKYATVGIYLYKRGSDFVKGAIDMIIRNDRINNEFYTCPVYNYLIQRGLKIGVFNIDYSKMHGLGTPEDLARYLE